MLKVPTAVVSLLALCWGVPSDSIRRREASHIHEVSIYEGRLLTGDNRCKIVLVESIAENMTYSTDAPNHASTLSAWKILMDQAKSRLLIASFYWSLVADPVFNFSAVDQGRDVYSTLLKKAEEINISIAQNGPKKKDAELDELITKGATVHWVDVARLLGEGIIHTKMWIADGVHGYLGSANMDWRSLTEVKELGALITNCPKLMEDMEKIHKAYVVASSGLPNKWPTELATVYNRTNPMLIDINGVPSRIYISSSPVQFNPEGREFDLDAILSTIKEAQKFIYISVMAYSPEIIKYRLDAKRTFWPIIDDALRSAAIDRGVEVRLLISRWRYTSTSMKHYLTSLRSLNSVQGAKIRVRYFIVPSFSKEQASIPHARVNHNKYMVTDKTAYIGTSNWSGDYFLYTGGAALVIEDEQAEDPTNDNQFNDPEQRPKSLRRQLTEIFCRDWNSEYAFEE